MKPIPIIFVVALAACLTAGCARPVYIAKSDARSACMRGNIAQVRETVFDNHADQADPAALPDTLGAFDTYTVVDYNRAGNITRVESFKGRDSVQFSKEEYLYDPSGERLERAITYDLARRGTTTVLYNYDSQGRLTSEVESNGLYRFDRSYDRRGYPKTRSAVNADTGKRHVIARYVHDRHGRLKRLRGERRQRYFYHPDGIVAEIHQGRNAIDFHDEHGNLSAMAVRIKRRNRRGRVFERFSVTLTAEYGLDARGNWIRRVMFYEGRVQSVAVREIDYYGESGQ